MLSLQSLTALMSTTNRSHGERGISSPAGASGSQRRGLEEKAEGPGQEGFALKESEVSLVQLLTKPPSTVGSGLMTAERCC